MAYPYLSLSLSLITYTFYSKINPSLQAALEQKNPRIRPTYPGLILIIYLDWTGIYWVYNIK